MSFYCVAWKHHASTPAASSDETARRTSGRLAFLRSAFLTSACVLAVPGVGAAATVGNPLCPGEDVAFNPGNGQDIVVPKGFKVSVFKSGLNFPTGIAFLKKGGKDDDDEQKGHKGAFEVFVLESGHGLPSRCNDETKLPAAGNPFTPDILVFSQNGALLRTLGKPTSSTSDTGGTNVFQPHGPAVDIAFENGHRGGRLFATDSNQATHAANGPNNSSRIVTVDPIGGQVKPFITQLPTGDHPTEQLAFKEGWIYWSQGSTTNSGVVGRDNGMGNNQQDIPCQDIVLSDNVFDSGGGVMTSGYSKFGTQRPGATVKAFETASHRGVCDGAILRARLDAANPAGTIEPFSWGYRNGYAIRFAPREHALEGGLLVGEDGADERGARPSNNAPDALHLAQQNRDGSPDYHGWPDRYGFLPTTQAVFNPVGGPGDDLCVPANNPPSMCTPASLAQILSEDVPIRSVLAFPPQQITSPLALEAADSSFTGIDFVPDSFVGGPVQKGAALYSLEGDFGFSAANATAPAPEVGHEVKLINFSGPEEPLELKIMRFAFNNTFEQAFVSGIRGFNRPTNVKFGPDGCAWVVDYGAVRDFGQSDPAAKFTVAGDGPLVQIPATGVIWRICPQ
jgi:glucose/arabinose dehydrogenase